MRKEKTIQVVMGIGIGLSIFGIAVFAQRAGDLFSFEQFRATEFLLRNPSDEDRPMVEVSPIDTSELKITSDSFEKNDLSTNSILHLENVIPQPILEIRDQRLPSRVASDGFRVPEWQMPPWVPYYRDQVEIAVRSEGMVSLDDPDRPVRQTAVEPVKENFLPVSNPVPQPQLRLFSPLSFSDSSLNELSLRQGEAAENYFKPITLLRIPPLTKNDSVENSIPPFAPPATSPELLTFRESSMGLRGGVAPIVSPTLQSPKSWSQGDTLALNGTSDETPNRFKDYTQNQKEGAETTDLKKENKLGKIEEDPGALLAKKNQQAKDIAAEPIADRRFTAVEKTTDLYQDSGTRMYAPGIKLGQFDLRFDLDNQFGYSDNYTASPKEQLSKTGVKETVNQEAAVTFTTSPSMIVASGERDAEVTDALYMAFRYTPSLINFIDVEKKDILNQNLVFNAGYRFSKLALVVDQSVTPYSGGDVEFGRYITRNFYVTGISAEYEVSDKTSLELGLTNSIRDYQSGFDSQETKVRGFANYSMTEKIRLGLGGAYGRISSNGSPNQDYQQALVRGVYFATAKTTLFAETGYEQRQVQEKSQVDNNIVFRTGGTIDLFPKTTLSVNASRNEIPSAVNAGTNVDATGIDASVAQTIYKFKVGIGGGYESVNYIKTADNGKDLANENYYKLNLSTAYSITDWWDIALSYNHYYTEKERGADDLNQDIESNETNISSRIKF